MGESLFGAKMFNLDQALHYGSFSHRVWSVSSGMHPVDLNLFGWARGPVSVGVTLGCWYLRMSTSCLSLTIGSLKSDWTHWAGRGSCPEFFYCTHAHIFIQS